MGLKTSTCHKEMVPGRFAYPAPRARMATTLADLLLSAATANPDRTAIIFPDSKLTYAELLSRTWKLARAMAGLGAVPGSTVGILMVNSTEQVVAMFAAALVGATIVPINARYRMNELAFVIGDANLRLIVTHDRNKDYLDFVALLNEALPGLADAENPRALALKSAPALQAVLTLGEERPGVVGGNAIDELAEEADDDLIACWSSVTGISSVAAVIYTSGTTANPSGVMLTHEALVGHWSAFGQRWGIRPDDVFWVPVPLFHIAAIGPLIAVMAHGGAFLSDSHFDAGKALEQIERHHATLLYPTYPPLTESLIAHPDMSTRDLSSVRLWLNVAPPDILRRMAAAFPQAVQLTTYGSTEGGAVTLTTPDDPLDVRIGTCGRPMPGVEVRVIDPEGVTTPHDQPGEIIYRGVNCFSGYLGDAEKTAATIRQGGWIHTGDLGKLDADGQLHFLGRIKEMLKVGGENVAPAEVEEHIASHPAVKLVQVVGIPDPRLTEVVAAFVELHEGADADERELIAFCQGRIASFKVPRLVRIVTEWPMSATKIQRNKLREALIRELGIEDSE